MRVPLRHQRRKGGIHASTLAWRPLRFVDATMGFFAYNVAMRKTLLSFAILAGSLTMSAHAETIGSVDTAWKMLGPNHGIVVDAFDDPRVPGVACYVSRSKSGGISGALGIAEDKTNASIVCQQVGVVQPEANIPAKEEVFTQKTSALFQRLRVVRMVDAKRKVLVYLTYSDRLIDGSPQNSLAAIPYGKP